jgi:hypothetical protein
MCVGTWWFDTPMCILDDDLIIWYSTCTWFLWFLCILLLFLRFDTIMWISVNFGAVKRVAEISKKKSLEAICRGQGRRRRCDHIGHRRPSMPRVRPSAQAPLYAEGKAVGVWPGYDSLADATCPSTPRERSSAYLASLDLTLAPHELRWGPVRRGPLEPST